jgi:hypothetical protein
MLLSTPHLITVRHDAFAIAQRLVDLERRAVERTASHTITNTRTHTTSQNVPCTTVQLRQWQSAVFALSKRFTLAFRDAIGHLTSISRNLTAPMSPQEASFGAVACRQLTLLVVGNG